MKTPEGFKRVKRCAHVLESGRICVLQEGHEGKHTVTPAKDTFIASLGAIWIKV